ncbi:MAG TPA: CPBP family intramembrane glutamic endopeptidase [Allosphingosinicella sp.]
MLSSRSEGAAWWAIPAFLLLLIPLSWYSWLLGYADDPGNSGINPLGPLVAALLVSAAGGWTNLKAFVRTVVRIRAHWTTYAIALLLPILLAVASVAIMIAQGANFPIGQAQARWTDLVDAFLIMFLFVALGEEPGWRGWLMPRLQAHLSPLKASLALAPVWALWHLPMLGEELPFDQLIPFLISLTAASIVLTWLTLRTRGGVLPAMICHATVNAIGGSYLFTFFSGADTTSLRWINAILWALAAILVAVLTRGLLGAGGGRREMDEIGNGSGGGT